MGGSMVDRRSEPISEDLLDEVATALIPTLNRMADYALNPPERGERPDLLTPDEDLDRKDPEDYETLKAKWKARREAEIREKYL